MANCARCGKIVKGKGSRSIHGALCCGAECAYYQGRVKPTADQVAVAREQSERSAERSAERGAHESIWG